MFYSISCALFTFLTIRALGRLLYWGQLAGSIPYVDVISEEEAKATIQKVNQTYQKEMARFKSTYLLKLAKASEKAAGKSKKCAFLNFATNRFPTVIISYAFLLILFILQYFNVAIVYWGLFAIFLTIYIVIIVLKIINR